MIEYFQLGVAIKMVDGISNEVSSIGAALDELSTKIPPIGAAVTHFEGSISSLKKAALIGGLLTPLILGAANFESSLSELKAVSGATTEQMQLMSAAAIEAGLNSKFDPAESVAGLTALTSAGRDATQAVEDLEPTLALVAASADRLSTDAAAGDIAATATVFEAKAQKVADTMITMANISTFAVDEIGAAWRGVNQIQGMAGQDINEMAAVMSALKQSGQTAIGAGEKTRMALTSLLTPSKKAREELTNLGVSVYDQHGKFRSMVDIFADLDRATSRLTDTEKNRKLELILMTEGLSAFNAISSVGITKVREWTREFENSEGAVQRFADTQLDNLSGKLTILQGNVSTLGVLLGQALIPPLTDTTVAITEMLSPTLKWLQTNPEVASWIVTTAGGIAVLYGLSAAIQGAVATGYALVGAYQILRSSALAAAIGQTILSAATLNGSGVIAGLGAVMTATGLTEIWWTAVNYGLSAAIWTTTTPLAAATAAVWAFNAALFANPLTWIIGGVVALGAALVGLVYYWDAIGAASSSAISWMGAGIDELTAAASVGFDDIKSRGVAAWEFVSTTWSEAPAWARGLVALVATALFPIPAAFAWAAVAAYNYRTEIESGLKQGWKNVAETAEEIWPGIGASISSGLEIAWDSIPSRSEIEEIAGAAFAGLADGVVYGVGAAYEALWSSWSAFREEVYTAGAGFIDAFSQGVVDGGSAALEAVKSVLERIGNFLPHSDADEGPLSTLTASGRALITTFASGMESEQPDLLSTISNIFAPIDLSIPMPDFQFAGSGSPISGGVAPPVGIFFNFENMIGEVNYDGTTRSGRGIDLAGIIADAIKKELSNIQNEEDKEK